MDELSKFLETHKNIAKIFSKEWFESELQKPPDTMHLLAKQFTFDDDPCDNRGSYHLFDHLDEYLENLEKDIQKKGSIFRKLRDSTDYPNIIGQIEICSFFKKLGFDVELEPKLPNSSKVSDIKIAKDSCITYVEIRTLKERPGTILSQRNGVTISTICFHPKVTIKNKIGEKSHQLSGIYPGILVICLDPSIARTVHIEASFFEIAEECPKISGLLLYHHFFNQEKGCNIYRELFCNPFATNPIPTSLSELFESGGVAITTWKNEDSVE